VRPRKRNGRARGYEDKIVAEMQARGRVTNASFFAFTATPKQKTLELFGCKRPDGQFEAFSLYSMRQAIEEKFILDVLKNYTTYKTYWRLLKAIEDILTTTTTRRLPPKAFVDLHSTRPQQGPDHGEHFRNNTAGRIDKRAKAMIVTAVACTPCATSSSSTVPQGAGLPSKSSWRSPDCATTAADYTEASMNGIPRNRPQRPSTCRVPFLIGREVPDRLR